jgi:alpha-1,3-rhamnosyl/mannosyltransferase
VRELASPAAWAADPLDQDAWVHGLAQTLDNAAVRAHLIAAGRAHAARFTWNRCAAETLAVYRGVLQRR